MLYYLHNRQTPTIKIKLITIETNNPMFQTFKVDAFCFSMLGPVKKEYTLLQVKLKILFLEGDEYFFMKLIYFTNGFDNERRFINYFTLMSSSKFWKIQKKCFTRTTPIPINCFCTTKKTSPCKSVTCLIETLGTARVLTVFAIGLDTCFNIQKLYCY